MADNNDRDLDATLGEQNTFQGQAKANKTDRETQSLGDQVTLGGGSGLGDFDDDGMEIVDLSARYKIERPLGKGGMGEVLLATDTRLGRKVAIKRISGDAARSKVAVNRFLTEAQSIAALNHPNIVQIHDYGRDHDGPFLIMEYVDGQTLIQRCHGESLPLQEAVDLTCDLLHGLVRAHDLGIIHRDIKPANILLTKDGCPKLTDFGLAKQTSSGQGHTMTGAVIGTIDFMPPEQRKDAALTDARSDLWSLAATLYQMVTGKSPKVIRLDLVPVQLTATLTKALEDDPGERFQSAAEFREALRRTLQTVQTPSSDEIIAGQCPYCGTKNEGSVRFCRECSAPLKIPCLNCNAEIPLWDKGCTECGARQAELLERRRGELQELQSDTERLIQAGRYRAASKLVESVGSLTDPRLRNFRQWLDQIVPDLKENTRRLEEQSQSALAEAVAHRAAWDYQAAVRTLQSLPAEVLEQEHRSLLEQLQSDWNESKRALQEIQRRLNSKELDGLLPLVRHTTTLRGDRQDLKKLLIQLEHREAKLVTAPKSSITPPPSLSHQPSTTPTSLATIALPDFVGVASAPLKKPNRNLLKDAAIASGILISLLLLLAFLRRGSNQELVQTQLDRSTVATSKPDEADTSRNQSTTQSNPPVTNTSISSTKSNTSSTRPSDITNSIGMKLKLIPKGTFMMGSPESKFPEPTLADEAQHRVTISKDYYIGVYEVTQAQYSKVMGGNPSLFQGDRVIGDSGNYPVEQVVWEDAVEFCKRLSESLEEKTAARVYRLPTEAEWEYACRAGTQTSFSFGENTNSLGDYAWYRENSNRQPNPIGKKKPNAWGLYDMHGNVWEWCSDWYGEYPRSSVTDPFGPDTGSYRVNRGGSWFHAATDCRSARRFRDPPVHCGQNRGFRVALSFPNATGLINEGPTSTGNTIPPVVNDPSSPSTDDWLTLFDGVTLNGWKSGGDPGAWRVENGTIVCNGQRSHLFYVGGGSFKNFHFKCESKSSAGANSGIYFHTRFKDQGFPKSGFECQLNNSGNDPRKTGSLYGIVDVSMPLVKNDRWFTLDIVVQGKRITIKVDSNTVVDYTEPKNQKPATSDFDRLIGEGIFALQSNSPNSETHFRKLQVKRLAD